MITASELLGEVRPPKLRGTPRTVRHLVDVDRLQWPAPVEVPKVKPARKKQAKPARLSPEELAAMQRANAANLHAAVRARLAAEAPARAARKARMAEVGAFIKQCRAVLGLSQNDVAALAGYPTRAQIGHIEFGRVTMPDALIASMAAALQCDPERLRMPPLSEYLEVSE